MSISEPFIRRPVATSLLTLAIALAGGMAFRLLPVAPLPQVDFPTISVGAGLPGASPETMASSVATPLERQFGHIASVTQMTSTSFLGSTSITLQFDLSRNVDAAARDVQAAINAARGNLPANLPTNPTYRKVNPADAPVLILSLTSNVMDKAHMYDIASSFLSQKFSQIKGVGQVIVGGSSLPSVRVELDPMTVNKYGISMDAIRTVISNANAESPKGELADGHTSYQLSTTDQIFKAAQYKTMVVKAKNGAIVRLSDLGDVQDSVQDLRNAGLANGKPAVLIIIFRQPGANIIDTVDRVYAALPQLQASIPAQVKVDVMVDRTTTIRASVRDVERTLLISIGLVILVVFLFLRNPTATFIPSIVVPISLIGTFGAMYLLNYSLDNLSLMALTISTGFVVDDAIVVIENISRYLEKGLSPIDAALKGSSEIGFTVMAMSLSLIAVFIPILMMGGIVGRLFREFAVTLSTAIVVSMVISLTATPMMCALFLKSEAHTRHGRVYQKSEEMFNWILNTYSRALRAVLRHPALTLTVLLITITVNICLYFVVPSGFFPQQDVGRLNGSIQADQDISFQAMSKKLNIFVQAVMSDPAVANIVAFTGGSGGTNTGRVFVSLTDLNKRKIGVDGVIARIRKKTQDVPGARLFLQAVQDVSIGGRASNAQYQYTLQSPDWSLLSAWAPKVLKKLRGLSQLVDVNTDQQDNGLQASLTIDRDTASRLGLTAQNIDDALYDAFGQRPVSTMYAALVQYFVIMEVAPQYWQSPDTLKTLYAYTPSGKEVPLSAFVHYAPTTTPLVVNHQGQFPSVTISFNLPEGISLGQAVDAISNAERDMRLPADIQGSFSGTAQAFQASKASEPILILTALIAVYIVLGMLYESLIHPITILSTLPSAGVGALLALLLCHTELSLIALIGIILLIGIVKKNAIMMIDFALEAERKEGKSPADAIYEACLLRFRPITMTTMAALLGALPLAFGTGTGSELRRPLGIAIVGGLIVSQMLTLFTTPVIYLYMERFARWSEKMRAGIGLRRPSMPAVARMLLIVGLLPWLGGCFGPIYHRPNVETPPTYKEQLSSPTLAGMWQPANPKDSNPKDAWWTLFADPNLNALEDRLNAANQNIKEAEANYRQAAATVSLNRAAYFPTVTTTPSVTRGYGPRGGAAASAPLNTFNDFTLPVDASWEPNLWNKIGLSVQNAAAAAQASNADLENMRLSMQATLASDYYTLESLDMQIVLLDSATVSYDRALQLTLNRFNAGIASQGDVVQAQTQLNNTRAQETDARLSRAQEEHAIAVLVGQSPSSFMLPPGKIVTQPPLVPIGLPAQLLERRPDIASAERQVAAANANVGLARVAYFPTLTLSASGGFESSTLADWISLPNRFWSIGASAAETLLDFGRRRAVRYQARAAYDATVAAYRQTTLSAFQDVEDNLAAWRFLLQESQEQDAATTSAEKSLQIENALYQGGTVSYLDVITTENITLASERASIQVLQRRMIAAVNLIRAIGGGWNNTLIPAQGQIAAHNEPK